MKFADELAHAVKAQGIHANVLQLQRWQQYLELIGRWNKVYNLTTVTDPQAMLTMHLLDSLSVAFAIKGDRILDVGSGAGLPGIPLAILFPDKKIALLDANSKKTRFQRQAIIDLKLDNVTAYHSRIEDFTPDEKYDTIISRAFSSLQDFTEKTRHLMRVGGQLLAMKGQYPAQELATLHKDLSYTAQPLALYNADLERHIIIIS